MLLCAGVRAATGIFRSASRSGFIAGRASLCTAYLTRESQELSREHPTIPVLNQGRHLPCRAILWVGGGKLANQQLHLRVFDVRATQPHA